MSDIKRIITWIFVLLGGTFLFYLWSNARMEEIKDLDTYTEEYKPVIKQDVKKYYIYSTSTNIQVLLSKMLIDNNQSTSTLLLANSVDYERYNFIKPKKDQILYKGCTYDIALDFADGDSPEYMGISLADFGTKKFVSKDISGLKNSITLKDNSFKWYIGDIWPGEYYLMVSMINGVDVNVVSNKFIIQDSIDGNCY